MSPTSTPVLVTLDAGSGEPLHRQIYNELRQAILSRRLPAGVRIPSSRALAGDLGVSRNTVMLAYDHLFAEGYLQGATGSGTYVASVLPDELLRVRGSLNRRPLATKTSGRLSSRGMALAQVPTGAPRAGSSRAFRTGTPALDAFPFDIWAKLGARRLRQLTPAQLEHCEPAGHPALRRAIAEYVRAARGVTCEPEQVIVVGAAQHALEIAARLLLDPGDLAWIEEPGYLGARGALIAAGATILPVPVDSEGLDVEAGIRQGSGAKLAYVSPSHQYPVGVTMSLSRRLALLQWATRTGAWIVEDDYDSEYRYGGRPLMALQGLDTAGRVIYVGTFSKTLFPALRLGYLVVPSSLAGPFAAARGVGDQHSPVLEQLILADFIEQGHFGRHIRRMRELYRERQEALLDAVGRHLGDLIEIAPSDTGMHLLGWLPPGMDDQAASRAAAEQGIEVSPLSLYHIQECRRGGLLFGYAGVETPRIEEGVVRLSAALNK